MQHKQQLKLYNVFAAKGITLTRTKSPRITDPEMNMFNVSKVRGLETEYATISGKVLIIHNKHINKYIKHIAGVKL